MYNIAYLVYMIGCIKNSKCNVGKHTHRHANPTKTIALFFACNFISGRYNSVWVEFMNSKELD